MADMTNIATLGIDGNAGFAHLGDNIQEGECEFETIVGTERFPDPASDGAKKQAIVRALRRLEERLGRRLQYYIGPSHPDHHCT